MSIYLRGKSWYYDFIQKGQRYTGSFGPVSRTVAKEEETRRKAAVLEKRLNPTKAMRSPRFEAFSHEYLEWLRTNRKPLTHHRVGGIVMRLLPYFGAKRLNEITAWQMEQHKRRRKEAGKKPATINLELAFMKAMLNKAVEWKRLAEVPHRHVKMLPVANVRTRFLSAEEEQALCAACSPELWRIIAAGLLTGFRLQELTSLRVEDVDLHRRLVTVDARFAKNGESRTIPIGDRLLKIFHEAFAARGNAPTVFVTPEGRPWTRDAFGMAFRKACGRAGIVPCGPHTLRHTFASRLVMAGVDLRTVQELLGHKDMKQTLRYAHLSPDHTRKAISILEEQYAPQGPAKSPVTDTAGPSLLIAKVAENQ